MNTIGARLVFDNAKRAIDQAFPAGANGQPASAFCKLTQSYLRTERTLVTNVTSYEFPILINASINGTINNTEQRLNQQDSFVCSEVGIFIGAPSSSADATYTLDTYANPVTYGVASVPMQTVWNGNFTISVNNDILMPAWDVARHYYAPETQATAAPAAGSPIDQKRLAVDGFYPMEPNVIFIGSKKNTLKIDLPAALAAVLADSRLIIVLRGVLAQNSTPVS